MSSIKNFNQLRQEIEDEAKKQKLELEWYKFRIQQMALKTMVKPISN